ncbi:hypothetical protein [Amycolatopsis tolypomycina]|uniref:PknH-like extracellular domain-containing protein n=1 Tax=Amycolatopsis tolypomycina TaxID=208445 RepID=A0A1H4W7K3_9PSEU|nr:hypothetical protein [Amycolatopsis tolypomycina]SEC89195.1 hypothetical protein SAMN04489727_5483 [Amycolatopsis tolypomycina]
MATRIRFPPLLLVAAAAVAGISPAKPAAALPVPSPPAVPPAALLPAEAIPGPPAARAGFDVATALSTSSPSTSDRSDAGECADVVHGRLLRPGNATGQGFQAAVPGGQLSELVARTPHPPGLTAWAAQARRCARVTVDDQDIPTVSTTTVGTPPAVPGAETLSYEQVLTLPGQPAGLPGLRLRTVAIAAGGVLVLLRDAGATDLDLDALAVAAWQHAAPRLGR